MIVWAPRMEKRKLSQIGLNVCGPVGILRVFKGTYHGSNSQFYVFGKCKGT